MPAVAADFKVPPTPDHYVTDNAGALSSDRRAHRSRTNFKRTRQATGHQIIVWIGETTGDVPLETWTGETADQWKIGRQGHDDGAVLFLFMQDHKVRIEVGYGLEGTLTDADSHRIIRDDIVPRMRAGNVDGAVSSGVAAMLTTITPAYKGVTPPPEPGVRGQREPGGGAVIVVVSLDCRLSDSLRDRAIVMRVVDAIRYGYLVMREGSTRGQIGHEKLGVLAGAAAGMLGQFVRSAVEAGGDFGGGFRAGGGSFGGGGASGGW